MVESTSTLSRWMVRCCFATSAIALATAAVFLAFNGSQRAVIGNQSLASLSAVVAASLTAVLAGWVSVAPAATIEWLVSHRRIVRNATASSGSAKAFCILMAIALAVQIALLAKFHSANEKAVDDQADCLRVANEVVAGGGPLTLPLRLWRGEFVEANRHPLYVILLSLHAEFTVGKWLSAAFAVCLTIATGAVGWQMYGPLVGGLAAALVAINFAILHSGSLVACETLLAILVLLGWQQAVLAIERRQHGSAPSLISGVFFGAAYLTKGTAFMLFVIVAGFAASIRWKLALLMAIGFVVIAFPLLVRNARVYGDPAYSYNTRFLFADSFDAGLEQTDLGTVGNARRYFANHGWREVASRAMRGLATEAFVIVRSLGPAPLGSGRAVFGSVLLLLALAEWFRERTGAMSIACVAFLWFFFAWYTPIATSDRFIVPWIAPLAIAASAHLVRLANVALGADRATPRLVALAFAALAVFCTWTLFIDCRPFFH